MAKKRENTSLDQTLAEVRSGFANLTPAQLEVSIDEAVIAVRKEDGSKAEEAGSERSDRMTKAPLETAE